MKRKHYLAPKACSAAELETESPILAGVGSQIDFGVAVDPLEEKGHYYDGSEETSDYLIVF